MQHIKRQSVTGVKASTSGAAVQWGRSQGSGEGRRGGGSEAGGPDSQRAGQGPGSHGMFFEVRENTSWELPNRRAHQI